MAYLIAFRNTLLIIAGMNAALMFPSWFLLKSRLPRRKPVPLRHLTHPWRDTTYTCFALGCAMYMFK